MDNHIPQENYVPNDYSVRESTTMADSPQQEDASYPEINFENRRKYPRSIFAYPVEVSVFSKKAVSSSFRGYLRDISMSGACLEFEDRYGRCNVTEVENSKVKISFTILDGEKVDIFAQTKWIKKDDCKAFTLIMGIEFKYMESWDAIRKLIGMKNKDRNMMWNLWEQYF